jgi:hypothetical protein
MDKRPYSNPYSNEIPPKKEEKIEQVHIFAINQPKFDSQSEVSISDYFDPLKPARPFKEMMDMIEREPRLQLARDTYIQMILGSGMKIKAQKKSTEKKLKKWIDEIGLEEKLEYGLESYVGVGNMIFETDPTRSDFVEVPIDTLTKIIRTKDRRIKAYITHVNNKDVPLDPENIVHFKLTNARQEVWGRGIFHALLNDFIDPKTGDLFDAPIFMMKRIEDNIVKIIDTNAAPIRMVYFEDAGENFLKTQGENLKKAKKGATVLTDKKFEIHNLETKGDSKYSEWIEHMQKNVLEPGVQFPLAFFNAGFTARASSESSDSVLIRKIKRIQKSLSTELKHKMFMPYLDMIGDSTTEDEFEIVFAFDDKTETNIADMITLYRDNGIRRSELRQNLLKHTTMEIDPDDMDDSPPITSVTDTGQFRDTRSGRFGPDDKNANRKLDPEEAQKIKKIEQFDENYRKKRIHLLEKIEKKIDGDINNRI